MRSHQLSRAALQQWQAELSVMPTLLAASARRRLTRLLAALQDQHCSALNDLLTEHSQQFARLIVGSDFALRHLCYRPDDVLQLLPLRQAPDDAYYQRRVHACLQAQEQLAAAMQALRQLRQYEQLALIWRVCHGPTSLWPSCAAQSAFADACLTQALQWVQAHTRHAQQLPPMIIFALGKLGAQALNLSSDVDVVFMQADDHDHGMLYTTVARNLVQLISARSKDGFVFRIDTRLRPEGDSGALVSTPAIMQTYYQERAREWERFAWTRARSLTKLKQADDFLRLMETFIYKNYSDYSVVDWLRSSPWRANQTQFDFSHHADLKQGPGGIREIEFIAQTFQLIHSNKDKHLRTSRMSSIFRRLSNPLYLGRQCDSLLRAYEFLRSSEHVVQMMADQQTHQLPQDELGRDRLAYVMGFCGEDSWIRYQTAYEAVRHEVQTIFTGITGPGRCLGSQEQETSAWHWLMQIPASQTIAIEHAPQKARSQLLALGVDDENILRRIVALANKARAYKLAFQTLGNLLAVALRALLSIDVLYRQPALLSFLAIVEISLGRSNYLVLLSEMPHTSERVLQLCAKSPWLTSHLSHHLFALEYLSDDIPVGEQVDFIYLKKYLTELLYQDLQALPDNKPSLPMNYLRRFKQAWLMRIGYADVSGSLPLMKLSDYLSAVADAVVVQAMRLAWQHLEARHGVPVTKHGRQLSKQDFLIIAAGKLGGLEMSYASDCDLVFIYQSVDIDSLTTGQYPLSAGKFFARLGQRIIHLLNSTTTAGVAYKVDMRLRPDGSQGLLVSSLDAYRQYQLQQARLWERQALIRARAINHDSSLLQPFAALRQRVLTSQSKDKVRAAVLEIRQKTRAQKRAPENKKQFHLKYSSGGSMDIEFLVQCCALMYASQYPSIIRYTDNMRQLDELIACGCLQPQQGRTLQTAWQHLRAFTHSCVLRQRPSLVPFNEIENSAESVKRVWQEIMGCS